MNQPEQPEESAPTLSEVARERAQKKGNRPAAKPKGTLVALLLPLNVAKCLWDASGNDARPNLFRRFAVEVEKYPNKTDPSFRVALAATDAFVVYRALYTPATLGDLQPGVYRMAVRPQRENKDQALCVCYFEDGNADFVRQNFCNWRSAAKGEFQPYGTYNGHTKQLLCAPLAITLSYLPKVRTTYDIYAAFILPATEGGQISRCYEFRWARGVWTESWLIMGLRYAPMGESAVRTQTLPELVTQR